MNVWKRPEWLKYMFSRSIPRFPQAELPEAQIAEAVQAKPLCFNF